MLDDRQDGGQIDGRGGKTQSAGLQRSKGRADVAFGPGDDGVARLKRLHQSGSAKAILPSTYGAPPEVVFLNTSGGLTGGDRLDYALSLAGGQRAVATTQTAERIYATAGGAAKAGVALSVGAGGWLDWLPQETIVFEGAALHRQVTLDLAPGAGCLFLESVILGRRMMNETLHRVEFSDKRMIRRDGRPVWAESLMLNDAVLARAQGAALLGGARAFATLIMVAPGAEDALPRLRAALGVPGVEAAASGFDWRCILRLLAADGWPLRQQVILALNALRAGPLPRVWQN